MSKTLIALIAFVLITSLVQSQSPKLILPIGHAEQVNDAQFSNDGKKIITISNDKTGKIWDAENGQILANLKHKDFITKGYFSPNGNTILTFSIDGIAKLWNTISGSKIINIGDKINNVNDVKFSQDGQYVFASFADSTVKLFDSESGILKFQIKNNKDGIYTAALNASNTQIATVGKDHTIRIWEVNTGKLLKILKGNQGKIKYIEYSPDDSKLISCSKDSSVRVWTNSGTLLFTIKGKEDITFSRFSPDNKSICTATASGIITISDCNNGKLLNTLYEKSGILISLEFSPNGNFLIAATNWSAHIWDATTWRSIRNIDLEGYGNYARFNYDGTKIVTALTNNMASVWDLKTKKSLLDLNGHTHLSLDINFNSDGQKMVSANDDNIGRIWDDNSKITNLLIGHTQPMNTAEFSKDGKMIITSSEDSTIKIWNANNSQLITTLKGHQAEVISAHLSSDKNKIISAGNDSISNLFICSTNDYNYVLVKKIKNPNGSIDKAFFSPDGNRFLAYSLDSNTNNIFINLGDANTGNLITGFKGIGMQMLYDAKFSPDSKKIITCSFGVDSKNGSNLQIWDASDGHFIQHIPIKKDFYPQVASYSPDGTKIICGTGDLEFKIFDATTLKEITSLIKIPSFPLDINFSPDGNKLLMSFEDNTARIWDSKTGKEIKKLSGHTDDVSSAKFSPDGKYIITNSYDNTYKRWTSEGKLLYTFFPIDHDFDYLAIDSFGRYDGTSGARNLLYFTCGTEKIELEQLEELSWQPNLVSIILGTSNFPFIAKKLSDIEICNNTPTIIQKGIKKDRYEFLVIPNKGGIGKVQLFINSQLRKEYPIDSLIKQLGGGYLLSIPADEIKPYFVSEVSNIVSVKATTSNGEMTSRGGIVETPIIKKENNEKPNIYIVSVGISEYKSSKLKLNYPSTDATSFASAVTASAIKFLTTDKEHIDKDHVHTYVFNTENDSLNWPYKINIQKKIEEIAKTAKADDVFILFFAGHGILLNGEKNFYLLTADATSFELSAASKNFVAISTNELREWMQKIKANKQLLILDACNSGKALEDLQNSLRKRGEISPSQTKALEDLKDKSGFFILAASASGQSAYEATQFGHGLLTYSLLSGIKLGTGLKDDKIDVTGWFNNALEKATELAKGIGGRQDPQIFANASFTVGIVDNEIKDGIHINKDPKKVFSKTLLFSDLTLFIDDIQLGTDFDNELAISSSNDKQSLHTFIGPYQGGDAYSIRGSYEIKDSTLTIKLHLVNQNKSVGNEIVKSAPLDQKDHLVKTMIDNIILLIK